MPDYVELHCHSNFSLLDGAAHPEALLARAAALGMPALALTDHDAVYGAVRFATAAQSYGVRPILGAELTLDGGQHLTLLVEDARGWRNLCTLISRGRQRAPKGHACLPLQELAGHTAGLIALSGCRRGPLAAAVLRGERQAALLAGRQLRDLFSPGCFWIELQHHLLPQDDDLLDDLVALARTLGVGYVATNNVHYAERDGRRLRDVLACIRERTTLDQAGPLLEPNSERYLKPGARLAPLFAAYPEALAASCQIAERCQFELQAGLQDLPVFPTPDGLAPEAYLRQLCEQALAARPAPGGSAARASQQLAHELAVIERAGLANYFLIVWEIVRFCSERGIRCQGRGSAANSLVAYLLDISPIDPLAHDLVFERFLSDERRIVPDIDIDFQADRREEVIQELYRRYGAAHAAMACTVVTFRQRSALRDIGRVLGLSEAVVAQAAERLQAAEPAGLAGAADQDPVGLLLQLCAQVEGFPRHLGIHNGGMVLTGPPLAERVATEPASMAGRVVVQWDKEALESIGLIKIDILGLRMLSAIADALDCIEQQTGARLALERLTYDDPAVYAMIAAGDTVGVFQVESRAQAQILPRLQPRCFADLLVSISLIRPGPLQGEMVHPYLRRRLGEEPVSYPHPLLEEALAETLGVVLFQEQVLKVARDLAGLAPGQGEQLRRALGARRPGAELERLQAAFIAGATARGVPLELAQACFTQLRAFGGYSFPKSHAAAFAVLVYQSAWLKHYYPASFYAGLLNHQPMGFWSPAVLVGDARRHGVRILPVDLEHSQARAQVEQGAVRLGLRAISGLGEASIGRLEQRRAERPFSSLADLCRRSRLPRRAIEQLVLVGALDGWGIPRRNLLWELHTLRYQEEELDLVFAGQPVELPPLTRAELLGLEQEILGLSPADHAMALYRTWLQQHGVLSCEALAGCRHGQRVQVAGLLVVHQAPPTARSYHFLTLEDETGMVNVILRPEIAARYRQLLRTAPALLVEGLVQRKHGAQDLLAQRIAPLAPPATE